MTKKDGQARQVPTSADVARMKSGFAKSHGGSTPPPPYVRRIERSAAKTEAKGGRK